MSDVFGDTEPEDSWDPDDEIPVQIDNLFRRLVLLGVHRARENEYEEHEGALVDELERLIDSVRDRRGLSARDMTRIRQLDEDLATIMERLR